MIAPRTALRLGQRCRACALPSSLSLRTFATAVKPPTPAKPAAKPATTYNKADFSSAASNGNGAAKHVPKNATYEASTIAHSDPDAGAAGPAIDNVDWSASYHGIATKPVTEAQFKVLMKPLDLAEIEVKPDGIVYLPEIKYRRRLNEAFGPMGWGMIPKGEAQVGDSIVTREYALIVNGR